MTIANEVLHASQSCNQIVEIGPGKGAITRHFLKKGLDLKLVEIDQDMIRHLVQAFGISPEIIISQNILEVNPYEIHPNKDFILFGNFPYNISSQILFWMLSAHEIIPEMIGMFQKEVAFRICSKPGNKQYGILSVLVQAIYDVEVVLELPSTSFNPAPKVDSAVIRCKVKDNLQLNYNQKIFKRIVKTTFNHRRKMLSTTLKHIVSDRSALNLDIFSKRPEHLSVEDFIYLTNLLEENIVNPKNTN